MTGLQMMVVLIVAMAMITSIIKAKHGHRSRGGRHEGSSLEHRAEANQLREEVKQLKDRLAVLERITIEKENSLEREIERLRDK